MYRHVARCHLKLAQLWRCPVAWCTVWKGALQDITDHVRYAHRIPEAVANIKIEKIIPPWTMTREVYTESLTPRHSGISNDILLFSDIGLSLSHHYRVHNNGVPHVAFRKDYMLQLRAMLPLPAAPLAKSVSPESDRSGLEESPEAVGSFQRPYRRAFARRRIPRVREIPTQIEPHLTELDLLAEAGAMVLDCRNQVLPGAIELGGFELAESCVTPRASTATSSPPEREQSFGGGGGGDLLGLICPELGVTPLVDPGTDCEDELPDPADIQSVQDHVMDGELPSVFMDVASLPTMITPVSDVDRECCAPEYVNAVIAPPAVLPVVIRAPAAAT